MWLGIFLTNTDETNPGAKELQKNISSMFSTSMEEMEQTLSLLSLQEGLVASFICLGHMKDGAEQHQLGHNITKNYWKCVGLLMILIAPKKGSTES